VRDFVLEIHRKEVRYTMGKTLSEKILSEKSKSDARAGKIVIVDVDMTFAQDVTVPLTIQQFKAEVLRDCSILRNVLSSSARLLQP